MFKITPLIVYVNVHVILPERIMETRKFVDNEMKTLDEKGDLGNTSLTQGLRCVT